MFYFVFIIMEFKKKDLILKEDKSEEGVIQKVLSKLKGIRDRAKSEVEETRALVRILTHAVRSYSKTREFDLDEKDREFIKGQSGDVVKNIILMVISIIPIPIPITPFLVLFGKKVGIDFIPKQQDIPEKGKKKEKLDEQIKNKLNIIITENQYDYILEATKKYKNIIHKLCANQKDNGSYCRLYDLYNKLEKENEDLSVDLVVAIEELDNYFKYKNIGVLPEIVKLALQDEGRTVSYLGLLVNFLYDETQDKNLVKKVLKKQKRTKTPPKNLVDLLATARYLEHEKYEKRFEGKHFEKHQTSLRLDYKCGDDAKERLFEILLQVNNKERAIDVVSNNIISCVEKSMTQGSYYVKADLKQTTDLTVSGVTVFPAGSLFEVKKMDPFIDSYLSEFFSIFKETDVIKYKGEIGLMYNELIQRIYEWLEGDGKTISDDYFNKIKSKIAGVIYDNDTIIPIKYIDLYWSNKGQRSCEEKRLSIRFRIDPEVSEINVYKFVDKDELVPVKITIPSNEKQKVICP